MFLFYNKQAEDRAKVELTYGVEPPPEVAESFDGYIEVPRGTELPGLVFVNPLTEEYWTEDPPKDPGAYDPQKDIEALTKRAEEAEANTLTALDAVASVFEQLLDVQAQLAALQGGGETTA